ncbi:MAG: cupin domain-containing protein [Chloroflexi bacterium]|nr:cupin domain-containing protein [Chloroflexota bacterium]
MDVFELAELEAAHAAAGRLYHEFLRHPSLSMGLYVLPAGGEDPQSPHTEDEVYYVLSGRAQIRVGEEDRPVQSGNIVFVEKHIPHRFHSIQAELRLLVFFAPAET